MIDSYGYGRVGQHRKNGSKGERKPGRHKHLWSYVLRYGPDLIKRGSNLQRAERKLTLLT